MEPQTRKPEKDHKPANIVGQVGSTRIRLHNSEKNLNGQGFFAWGLSTIAV